MSELQALNAGVLATLLSELGGAVRPQRLLDLARGVISLRFASLQLRALGEVARPVTVNARALSRLATPTLLLLASGELVILDAARRGHVQLRRASGRSERHELRALLPQLQGALARGPRWQLGTSFLAALAGVLACQGGTLRWLLLIQLAAAALAALVPWLTRLALGAAVQAHAPSLLDTVVTALAMCAGLQAWLGWLGARTRQMLDAHMAQLLGRALLGRVLALPYAEHQARGLGGLLQTLGSGEALARAAGSIGLAAPFELFSALLYLALLACAAPAAALWSSATALLAVLGALVLARHHAALQAREIEASALCRARLHELVQGIATWKSCRAEAQAERRWLDALLGERICGERRQLSSDALELWLSALRRGAGAAILIGVALEVLAGRGSAPELIYLSLVASGFLHAVMALCRSAVPLLCARAHLAHVDALLRVAPVPAVASSPRPESAAAGAIELDDVWFRHGPDQPWILRGYSLHVAAGELLRLRGPSGAGKTTILRLIAGLYSPERGSVTVGGRSPRQSGQIAYLPQHVQLFSCSLRENLERLSGASLERVHAACARTGLDQWLETLPMGLETLVSPGGGNLSGGQRQWLVLTAAVASERPVLLLDEAMSQMDRVVRARLDQAQLFAGRTTLSVCHDE